MGKPVVHSQTIIEGAGETVGVLRKDLRLQDSAHCRNELPLGRNRRPERHQRRHYAAVPLIVISLMNLHKEKTWRQKFS